MAYVDWMIRGPEIGMCNCDWGCPCQFNAPPTRGNCRAVAGLRVDEGHFGDVRLDGLKAVAILAWPGAIHEGHGEVLPIVDERASPEQREALLKILGGEETEEFATIFNVVKATTETVHEPLFLPIEFEADEESRTGRVSIPGILEASAEPIRNPVTGAEHRAKVVLPHGFEYKEAEYASSNVKTTSTVEHDWTGRHAHFCMLHLGPYGIIQ
ncbi:DUF1326 domain-containing protein [Chelativorans alearense]|uniref:DUF1326 domain-containing protein n=1 Tax=Chelativorans alearense TaxID=2681495 RepID=UPI0013D24943|nr:DUF1326 domain-containing protein [Chelativorans alearense]